MFTWQRDQRWTARPAGNGGQTDEAMDPADFLREIFEDDRRAYVPDGHEFMEHLRDEPISTRDAVGVAFGERSTLQRLYDEGRVKLESDAHFRQALGMPPRPEQPAMALAAEATGPGAGGGQGGQPPAQGLDPHEDWRIKEKQRPETPQAPAAPAAPAVQGLDPHEARRLEEKRRGQPVPSPALGGQPSQTPPPLGADPHEDWRLRQKPQDVQPMPKPEEEPGFLGKVGDGLEKTAKGTWDALVNNEKLHQGVEVGARAAWEVSKWGAVETAKRVKDILHEAKEFEDNPGLGGQLKVVLNRFKNPVLAYQRIPEYRKEIEELVRKIEEEKKKTIR